MHIQLRLSTNLRLRMLSRSLVSDSMNFKCSKNLLLPVGICTTTEALRHKLHISILVLVPLLNPSACSLYELTMHWLFQDISNLRDFFEVNLEMTSPGSPISVFDVEETIVSRGHILPPAMVHKCEIVHSLMGEGSALRVGH